MRLALRRLGAPQAISWFSFAFLVVLQGTGSIVSSLAPYDGRLLEFLAVRLAAFLPLGLVLAVGRFTLNRVKASALRSLLTVTTLILAVSAGTAAFDALLVATSFTEDYVFPRRLVTSLPGTLTGSILISLLVVSAREQSLANVRLLSAANRLVAMRGDVERRISERRDELVRDIRAQIEAQFQRLDSQDAANASVLRDLIDDTVRPLSYSLAKRPRSVRAVDVDSVQARVDWGTVVSSGFQSSPFHWRLQSLVLGAIGATFLLLNFGLSGLFATVGLVLATGLVAALAGLSWRNLPSTLPVSTRITLFTLVSSTIAYSGAWIVLVATGFSLLEPVKFVAWWIIVTVTMLAASLVVEVFRMLRATDEKLSATLRDLKKEVATLNTSLRQLHRSISRILHGPVQEAVFSMMVDLERQPERLESPEILETLRTRMTKALSHLDTPSQADSDPEQVVANLRELWTNSVDITLDATPEDLEYIRLHQQTAYAVSEVVREACQNGLRHGQATAIAIAIRVMPDKRNVEVSVRNTGIPVQADVRRGLGSQLFDDLSLQWECHPEPNGTRFQALLPLITNE